MNMATIGFIASVRNLNHSQLANLCGVSRQAVSLWFKNEGEVSLRSNHLNALIKALKSRYNILNSPLPLIEDFQERHKVETQLLWDSLYPSLAAFLSALWKKDQRALARFVQVYGFFEAEKVVGKKKTWDEFNEYKRFIKPPRRKILEVIWKKQKELDLI